MKKTTNVLVRVYKPEPQKMQKVLVTVYKPESQKMQQEKPKTAN